MLIMFASRSVVIHPGVSPKGLFVDIWYDREAPTLDTTKLPAPECTTRSCPTGGKFARYALIAPRASVDGIRWTTTWEFNWNHCGEALHRSMQLVLKHQDCWTAVIEVGDAEVLHIELPDYDPDWPPHRRPSIWARLIRD